MHERREHLLDLLRSSPAPRDIAGLAAELDVHPNTVRFHLDGLLASGLIEQAEGAPTSRGRPPVLFRATRRMDPDGPTNYRLLATILTDQLADGRTPAATAAGLGRRWGQQLPVRTVRALVRTLDDLGFAPEPAKRDSVSLRHCPFLDLVTDEKRRTVTCALHLGLMQGALSGSAVTVERLEPFVEPDRCVAHLAPAGTA